jgi:hypothetical protein
VSRLLHALSACSGQPTAASSASGLPGDSAAVAPERTHAARCIRRAEDPHAHRAARPFDHVRLRRTVRPDAGLVRAGVAQAQADRRIHALVVAGLGFRSLEHGGDRRWRRAGQGRPWGDTYHPALSEPASKYNRQSVLINDRADNSEALVIACRQAASATLQSPPRCPPAWGPSNRPPTSRPWPPASGWCQGHLKSCSPARRV